MINNRPSHEMVGECKHCGKFTNISRRRICVICGDERATTERIQLKDKKGEHFDKWKKGILKGIAGIKKGK